ncbi:branched-chain amino acid ABC transporter permease [Mesorhizobium sp.]|uniref:branched-chain amino acid ABC transporter permease n=1 Tax=Mesorhizobium sp. TaxID=1871066 RepID=UPI0025D82581|nr:branched-chain amino acid ABC transporter permease [Mesorhizobium sp.]
MSGMPGGTWGLLGAAIVGLAILFAIPLLADPVLIIELTSYVILAILALSLGVIWGYGGILCFGQSAFFGLGAYAYAIAAINMGDSTVPLVLSIVVPALFAAFLGYFLFYARITDVYFGVITLTVTLILYKLMGSTSGAEYTIGSAPIGGYNGIPAIPPLNLPGSPDTILSLDGLYYASGLTLLAVYLGLRLMLKSRFGQVLVAVRENERRAELLGYDARFYKLAAFTLGGGIAGLSGCLFANWGMFISPDVFNLAQSAQVIIWVIVGGTGTLLGPIVGCFLVQWLSTQLGTQQYLNANLVLGTILIGFVLLVPKGIVPMIAALSQRAFVRRPAMAAMRERSVS